MFITLIYKIIFGTIVQSNLRRSEDIKEAVRDLELLCIKEEYTDMGRAKKLCDKRVAELRKAVRDLELLCIK